MEFGDLVLGQVGHGMTPKSVLSISGRVVFHFKADDIFMIGPIRMGSYSDPSEGSRHQKPFVVVRHRGVYRQLAFVKISIATSR